MTQRWRLINGEELYDNVTPTTSNATMSPSNIPISSPNCASTTKTGGHLSPNALAKTYPSSSDLKANPSL